MNHFLPTEIGIATATLYPTWAEGAVRNASVDQVRGDLALELIDEANKKGFQIVVVDGGSSEAFEQAVRERTSNAFRQLEPGMSAGRRQALTAASSLTGVKVICWTEPEKVSIVRDCLEIAAIPLMSSEADIVVPSRDAASFATYPDYQAEFEIGVDRDWNDILRSHKLLKQDDPDLDACIGPRLMRNDVRLLSYFLNRYRYKNISDNRLELWPNALFSPLIHAMKDGVNIVGVPVPYRHPESQTKYEQDNNGFRDKRAFQRDVLLTAAKDFVAYLQKSPDDPTVVIEKYQLVIF